MDRNLTVITLLATLLFAAAAPCSAQVAQEVFVKAAHPTPMATFGNAIAISGDTVVIGAGGESSGATGVNGNEADASEPFAGAAYVFVRDGASWTQQAYLKASNTESEDAFGSSVAISGDTIVVGAHLEDSGATGVDGDQSDESAGFAGAAYVFVRSGTTWTQQAYLKASNTGSQDQFGRSVAISGDTIAIGAWGEDSAATGVGGNGADDSAAGAGAVYVFTRTGSTWTQQAYLKASNTDAGDGFGIAVALHRDTLVVGAYAERSSATGVGGNESDDSLDVAGAAYVFVRSGSTWTQQAYLKPSNTDAWDRFGSAVAVSGDTVAVGAWGEDSPATGVGAAQGNGLGDAGAVYVFTRSGTAWSQEAYVKPTTTDPNDRFGEALALHGDALVVGSRTEDGDAVGVGGDESSDALPDAGAAWVFTRDGSTWSQLAYLKASNTDPDDAFGSAVAVEDDTLVVGAVGERGSLGGVGAFQGNEHYFLAGAAYVFDLGRDWVELHGCHGNTARWSKPAVPAAIGTAPVATLLGDVVSTGVVATYFGARGVDALGCGLVLSPGEELLLALAPFPELLGLAAMAAGAAPQPVPVPNVAGLVGFHVTLQAVAIDTTTFDSEFSTGLEFEIRP